MVCEQPAIFDLLVQAGADPHAKNNAGQSIIEKAIEDDNEELINHLKQIGIITDPNFTYTSPADAADVDPETMEMQFNDFGNENEDEEAGEEMSNEETQQLRERIQRQIEEQLQQQQQQQDSQQQQSEDQNPSRME